jgi:hypothetical protein
MHCRRTKVMTQASIIEERARVDAEDEDYSSHRTFWTPLLKLWRIGPTSSTIRRLTKLGTTIPRRSHNTWLAWSHFLVDSPHLRPPHISTHAHTALEIHGPTDAPTTKHRRDEAVSRDFVSRYLLSGPI